MKRRRPVRATKPYNSHKHDYVKKQITEYGIIIDVHACADPNCAYERAYDMRSA